MMVSEIVNKSRLYVELAQLKNEEEKAQYMSSLFQQLVGKPLVKELYIEKHDIKAAETIQLSSDCIYQIASDAIASLYQLGNDPIAWDKFKVNKIIEKGVSDYWSEWKRERNDTCLLKELKSPSSESPALILEWLKEGSNIETYDIYRILFQSQNEFTAGIVAALLECRRFPEKNNVHSLFVHNSPHTLEILKELASFKLLTPTCLTFAIRYSGTQASATIKFLLKEDVVPDKYHWSFASKHLDENCRRLLKNKFDDPNDDSDKCCVEDDYMSIGSQPSVYRLLDLNEIIKNPGEEALSDLVSHVYQGHELTSRQFNELIEENRPFSLELLRVYFMYGFKLSEKQLKGLLRKNNEYTPAIIKIARMYGLEITDQMVIGGIENKKNPVSELTLQALTMEVPIYPDASPEKLDELVSNYVHEAPGVFELLIRSGVHPGEELLKAYKEVPKDQFFKHLLEKEPFFEFNCRNEKLLKIAIQTSTSDVISSLLEKGFLLRIKNVINAILHQPPGVGKDLIETLKNSSSQEYIIGKKRKHPNDFQLTEDIFDDPIAMALLNQDAQTFERVKQYIEEGARPKESHVLLILQNPTIYSPELIYLLEENGVSIEFI
jgi:uncharacterized protein YneF (UPF0154 family)